MPIKTEAEHIAEVKTLLVDAVNGPVSEAAERFGAVERRIELAQADGVARSLFPQDIVLPTVATRAHGLAIIPDAIAKWCATGWLST